MTAPNPQQMQSRNDRPKVSVRRRRMGSSRKCIDGEEGELDSRLPESNSIARVHPNALRHALSIHERAAAAMVDEHDRIALAHESAMPSRDAGEPLGQTDRVGLGKRAADNERTAPEHDRPRTDEDMSRLRSLRIALDELAVRKEHGAVVSLRRQATQ